MILYVVIMYLYRGQQKEEKQESTAKTRKNKSAKPKNWEIARNKKDVDAWKRDESTAKTMENENAKPKNIKNECRCKG